LTTGEELNLDTGATAPETVTEDTAMGAVWDRANVQNGSDRGEGGKFVSPAAAEGAQGGSSPEKAEEGAADAQPSPVVGVAAPAHLPQSIKQHWDKYGPEAQAAIATHTAEMDRKFGEIGKQYGAVKPIADKIMGAAQQYDAFKGMSPDQIAEGAISLAGVQAALLKSPESAVSMLMDVAKSYNVLPQLARAFGQQGDSQVVTALEQKISTLESKLEKSGNPDTLRELISAVLAEKSTETTVIDFAKGKDHWAEVEANIPTFINVLLEDPASAGKSSQEILDAAYDMAINALPSVRAKVRASEAKATAAGPDPKRTEAAKKAASINVPSNGVGKERQLTEDEAYGAAYDRKMAS
jgi:TolA-binding protein